MTETTTDKLARLADKIAKEYFYDFDYDYRKAGRPNHASWTGDHDHVFEINTQDQHAIIRIMNQNVEMTIQRHQDNSPWFYHVKIKAFMSVFERLAK